MCGKSTLGLSWSIRLQSLSSTAKVSYAQFRTARVVGLRNREENIREHSCIRVQDIQDRGGVGDIRGASSGQLPGGLQEQAVGEHDSRED